MVASRYIPKNVPHTRNELEGPCASRLAAKRASSALSRCSRCAVLSYSWPRKDSLSFDSSQRLDVRWKPRRCVCDTLSLENGLRRVAAPRDDLESK